MRARLDSEEPWGGLRELELVVQRGIIHVLQNCYDIINIDINEEATRQFAPTGGM